MSTSQQIDHTFQPEDFECPLRITVNAHCYGTSNNGIACSATGGRCIPSIHCEQRRENHFQEEQILSMINDHETERFFHDHTP